MRQCFDLESLVVVVVVDGQLRIRKILSEFLQGTGLGNGILFLTNKNVMR